MVTTMRYKSIITFSVFLLFPAASGHGDIMPTLASGGTVFPVESNDVAMRSGRVIIAADGTSFQEPCHKSWHYECTFELENTAKKKIKLQVGFPLPESSQALALDASADDVSDIGNFSVSIDGSQVDAEKKVDITVPEEGDFADSIVFVWTMSFKPSQTRVVRIAYDAAVGCNTKYLRDNFGYAEVKYILRSGALWKDPIGVFDMEIHFKDDVAVEGFDMAHFMDEKELEEQGIVVDKERPFPPGGTFTRDHENSNLVWHMEGYVPEVDLDLAYLPGSITRTGLRYSIEKGIGHICTKEEALEKYNLLLATFGKTFDDPSLQEKFSQEPWYIVDPGFSMDRLTEKTESGQGWGNLLDAVESRMAEIEETGMPIHCGAAAKSVPVVKDEGANEGLKTDKLTVEKRGGCACDIVM